MEIPELIKLYRDQWEAGVARYFELDAIIELCDRGQRKALEEEKESVAQDNRNIRIMIDKHVSSFVTLQMHKYKLNGHKTTIA